MPNNRASQFEDRIGNSVIDVILEGNHTNAVEKMALKNGGKAE
jgi:hypothetical protein